MLKYDNPVELPRKLGKHAFIVLYVLQAAAQMKMGPVSAQWVRDQCPEFGVNTITDALRKLTSPEIQMAIRTSGGWMVNAENAFQLPLGYSLPAPVEPGQNHSQGENHRRSENHSQSDFGGQQPEIIDVLPAESALQNHSQSENHSQSDFEAGNPGSIKILIDDESLTNIDSSSIMNPPGGPTLKAILENLHLLFGDALEETDVPADTPPQLALAWVCKCYRDKLKQGARFKNPVGTIIVRLRSKQPRRVLHLDELPDAYLDAIGLWHGACQACAQEFTSRAQLGSHVAEKHADPDPESGDGPRPEAGMDPVLDHRTRDGAGPSPNQAWSCVVEQLRMEMPRASFDTWVRDTVPVAWVDGVLEIGVCNTYARDWCESRLLSTVARLLVGILDCTVDVRFVVTNLRGRT